MLAVKEQESGTVEQLLMTPAQTIDRSWYNRAGVEYVMDSCTKQQHRSFLALCPVVEGYFIASGFLLIRFWLEVSNEEQEQRFEACVEDSLRQWKLSPIDLPSRECWYEYSRAHDMMLEATDTSHAPLCPALQGQRILASTARIPALLLPTHNPLIR